jgi:eukaryotic-like serine/threonine-protein kinase
MASRSDQNLLFGIIALQMDFVRREQLVAATSTWLTDKSRTVEEILVEQGALSAEDRNLLGPLVARHLENHGGDPQQSLAVLSSIGSVADELRSLGDENIEATLSMVASNQAGLHAETEIRESKRATLSTTAHGVTEPRFRILRSHAKGGLGEVYVAKDTELNREVALKEIHAKYADDEASRLRFLLEAEVTGGLEHPGIVPVYGLGRYDDGRPFYAMRFIRGDSLQEAANRFHGRSIPGRETTVASKNDGQAPAPHFTGLEFRKLLGRFIDVCQAIAYAHSRGVLHRDLKPGNIMLGKYGETLVVDWGLAKPQGRDDTTKVAGETTLRPASASGSAPTLMGSAIGTPAFMPPEQAAGRLDNLGPTSDVYSLGATLYYVLTGKPPFSGADLTDVLQQVQSGDFPSPRDACPRTPKPLDAICLRAMATQPADRYASPQELAEDVERYLADEAVTAFREPAGIRARRWLRKHPKSVAALAATILVGMASVSVVATVVSATNRQLRVAYRAESKAKDEATVQRKVASNAEQLAKDNEARAEARMEEAKTVLAFFETKVLAAARPEGQGGGLGIDATIRAAVDAAEPMIADSFKDNPLVEASIRATMGTTYNFLGDPEQAIRQHERARDLHRSKLGMEHASTVSSIGDLALTYHSAGRLGKALPLHEETLKLRKTILGPEHPDTLTSMNNLANAYNSVGRLDEMQVLYRETLKLFTAKLGPVHPSTLASMGNLASTYLFVGRLEEALPLHEETLKLKMAALGPEHASTLASMNDLARVYLFASRRDEALPIFE